MSDPRPGIPESGPPDDAMPTSRGSRVGELGLLGVRLTGLALRAGAGELLRSALGGQTHWGPTHVEAAETLFDTLGRMRGLAAKAGQLLAQRPGMLPDEYVKAMSGLTNRVPPMSFGLVKTQIVNELGRPPHEAFVDFERRPMASASLGQVHRARLADGTRVAVKVQYPAVERSVRADLDNLRLLVGPASMLLNVTNLAEMFQEVADHFSAEVDYRQEADNLEAFGRVFAADPEIRIPGVHRTQSTQRVLTMDLLEGADLETFLAGNPSAEARRRRTAQLLRLSWVAMFGHRILHADPNPGNFLFAADGSLGVVDFGCVKRFPPTTVESIRTLIAASLHADERTLDEALSGAGLLPPGASGDLRDLLHRSARLWARPFVVPSFDFGDRDYLDQLINVNELTQQAFVGRDAVSVPSDWIFYGRQLVGQGYLLWKLAARGPFGPLIEPFIARPSR